MSRQPSPTVQLLVTCLVDSLFPAVGEAVVSVLRAAGVTVQFPARQTCCGQPAYNGGYHTEAKRLARHTIQVLERTQGAVVVPSGSCAAMIRHGYAEVFADAPDWSARARALAGRTYEFSQYLVDEIGFAPSQRQHGRRLAYQPSCHLLRGLGIDRQPMTLLDATEGSAFERLPSDCCGFGGLFAIEHEAVSTEMLRRKLDQIEASGAEAVVACDVSCLMQIEGGLRRAGSTIRCMHLAQALAGEEPGLA